MTNKINLQFSQIECYKCFCLVALLCNVCFSISDWFLFHGKQNFITWKLSLLSQSMLFKSLVIIMMATIT